MGDRLRTGTHLDM